MPENRQLRDRLTITIRVSDSDTGQPLGHVRDVSMDGISTFGRGAVQAPEQVRMTLHLPWSIDGVTDVTLQARRRWLKHLDEGRWHAGYHIEQITPEQALVLEKAVFRFTADHH